MGIPVFLAMTPAELPPDRVKPMAWMACHFSQSGKGLSCRPRWLPAGSMLILDDSLPFCDHDPSLIARQMRDFARELECESILLDFQRPVEDGLFSVVDEILRTAPCPVGVSTPYGMHRDCALLFPPVPPHVTLEDALGSYQGRELWLELSREGTELCITSEGSRYSPLPGFIPPETAHRDEELFCHYTTRTEENAITFCLGRRTDDEAAFLHAAEEFGVTRAVALWQEFYPMDN